MQRKISLSDHKKPTVNSASTSFSRDYDYATSLCPSIPRHSPLMGYCNSISSLSLSLQNDDAALPSGFPQIDQQRLHQDLMCHHQGALSHLRDVTKQAQALRQENVNLKVTNLDLNNRLNLMLNPAPFHGANVSPGLDSVLDGIRKMRLGCEEKDRGERKLVAESTTSVTDSASGCQGGAGRFHLPKSISVRSSGYLKAGRTGWNCVKPPNQNKVDNGSQRVYVKGGVKKEQGVELEVYNQGMFKTELCNKWQQSGSCPYGNNCQFAHGMEELRPVLRHPRYKTEVCRMVLNGIPCPYGHRCHFRHTLTEQEQVTKAMISSPQSPKEPPHHHQ